MFFSGRVKSYEYTSSLLLEFVRKHSMDVFCSINSELDEYHINFLTQFNVKGFVFEKFELPKNTPINAPDQKSLYAVLSMFKNQKNCIDLISEYQNAQGIAYDLVIYMRADLIPRGSFDFDLAFDDSLHIPNVPLHVAINDQIAYGSFPTMKKYCSVYENLEDYSSKYKIDFVPETLLKFHLDHLQVPITYFDFSYTLNRHRHDQG